MWEQHSLFEGQAIVSAAVGASFLLLVQSLRSARAQHQDGKRAVEPKEGIRERHVDPAGD